MRGLSLHRGLSAFRSGWRRALLGSAFAIVAFTTAESQAAGSIFITGHDPDFHASLGGNALGAQRINQVAISFIQDPFFNPYFAGAPKFLFVESSIAPPGGHTVGKAGIIASGYVEGVNFEHHDASTLNAELNLPNGGAFRDVRIDSAHSHVICSNRCWSLPDLTLARPEGRVEAQHWADDRTGEFHWHITSSMDPKVLLPLLGPADRKAFDLFTLTQPPIIDADIWGRGRSAENTGIRARIAATSRTK